jgi:hypothetical protein
MRNKLTALAFAALTFATGVSGASLIDARVRLSTGASAATALATEHQEIIK